MSSGRSSLRYNLTIHKGSKYKQCATKNNADAHIHEPSCPLVQVSSGRTSLHYHTLGGSTYKQRATKNNARKLQIKESLRFQVNLSILVDLDQLDHLDSALPGSLQALPLTSPGSISALHPQRSLDPHQPPLHHAHPLPGGGLRRRICKELVKKDLS